jgi:hypothetical protein
MPAYAHILLDKLNWPYNVPTEKPTCAKFAMSMGDGEIPVTVESFGASQVLLIYLHFALIADHSKRCEAAMLLCRINNEIPMGRWCIDGNTGEIWFRITMYGGTDDDAHLLDDFVELARKAFADWQKPISVVLTSEILAENAFTIKLLIDMETPEKAAQSLQGKYRP